MKIIQLEDGSYVCAWEVEGTTTVYIQLQRISKTGELLWNEAVTRLYSASTFYEYPYLVNAGNNQALVVFSKGMMYNKTIKSAKIRQQRCTTLGKRDECLQWRFWNDTAVGSG